MCPTSIAVSNCSAPPQCGQVSPSRDSRRSAKRGWKSRPASTPRRCQPSRFAPATNCPSRSASSATTSALEADRAERAARGAERARGSPRRSTGGTARRALRRASPARCGRRRARVRARRAVVGRHGHRLRGRGDVDREELAPAPRTSSRRASRPPRARRAAPGTPAARGTPRATSRSAAKSPFSQVTSVFSPAPAGARKSTDSLPPIIPDSASTLGRLSPQRSKIALVRAALQLEARGEPRLVAVERVRVLHDELAQRRISPARGRGSSRSLIEKW